MQNTLIFSSEFLAGYKNMAFMCFIFKNENFNK